MYKKFRTEKRHPVWSPGIQKEPEKVEATAKIVLSLQYSVIAQILGTSHPFFLISAYDAPVLD